MDYYYLNKGDIIQAGDDVFIDEKWIKTHAKGTKAPDPLFTSHRKYRRKKLMVSYLSDRKAINRLKKEYQEHKNLVIGFDFDSTVFDYHKEGLYLQPVIDLLKQCSDLGFTMCLHSNCQEEGEGTKKAWHCSTVLGFKVAHINKSPLLDKQDSQWNNKPFYSILLDDRAGLSASFNILKTTLKELNL